ncbi:cysteine-rich receptor-like protein kinase 25 [Prosopis cineraria]|uniref:cysteine-rich receptor-like protein kinase 25 n=1 Tax=Prosopis cineraria TaxID=364024 RepID=UPI0024108C40|nr:cysteine-rich receptor-like protein kinase 25 [Prosopis cineraria]
MEQPTMVEGPDANSSRLLNRTLIDVLMEAVKSGNESVKNFATKQANRSDSETMFTLAQCTPDLSPQNCAKCLLHVIQLIPWGSISFDYGRIVNPSCNLRFGTYRFYYKNHGKDPPPDSFGSTSEEDDPELVNYDCGHYAADNAYRNNVRSLTLNLSTFSNSTENNGFYNATIVGRQSDTIYGLFMCRGDVSRGLCRDCVNEAIQKLNAFCDCCKEAVMWYDVCMLRYSNRSFFSIVDTEPPAVSQSAAKMLKGEQEDFNRQLATNLDELVKKTTKPGPKEVKNFAKQEAGSSSGFKKFYALAQCTPDLSSKQCEKCLRNATDDIISCCIEKQGGTVMYPSCNLRFQLYQFFYDNIAVPSQPPAHPPFHPPGTTGKHEGKSRTIIIVVILIVVSTVLFGFGYYCWRRKKIIKSSKAILKENFGSESATLESLHFKLATIEAATNRFSNENRIGKGGFGEVYKGILPDGKEIAVKRLSESSRQGLTEFKNEVLLIAKLQHRNLVALLGFCLKGQEKILVYEYVPNKSLDFFLFGSQKERALTWSDRFKIIRGIARGILYLHEHSRLKVIHRDLKPSNILLDDEMNPKISDFGLAKMVGISETRGSTDRIVGTLGYMSPEYIKFGVFSEKSDVFSFGVMVLEIVSGKEHAGFHHGSQDQSHQYSYGLLSSAWKHWRDETLKGIFDSNLVEADSHHNEMIKCIHIGLLCVQSNPGDRPSMNRVVQYLSNDSMHLPIPQEPAFFIHGQMDSATTRAPEAQLADRNQCSVDQMSQSISFPR